MNLLEYYYWIFQNFKFLFSGWVVYMITCNLFVYKTKKGRSASRYIQGSIENTGIEHSNINVAKTKTQSYIQKDFMLSDKVEIEEKEGKWKIISWYGTMKFIFFPVFVDKNK